jgi:hypothetical protein
MRPKQYNNDSTNLLSIVFLHGISLNSIKTLAADRFRTAPPPGRPISMIATGGRAART